MSLITACPACHTEFEATQEQLEAYEGKVRCGTCQHVFNAREHLIEDDMASQSHLQEMAADTHQRSMPQGLQVVDDGFVIPPKVDLSMGQESNVMMSAVPSFLQGVELESPSLHQQQPSKHGLRNALIALGLSVLLALQTVFALRTYLAAQYPLAKPWLIKGCGLIGCKVELPKNIALLTIDDADMQEHLEREGVLEFSSTLINHGNIVQSFPLIELTLTNTDDEPVMRRSFKPQEYLQTAQQNHLKRDVEAGLQGQEEVRVKMSLSANNVNVAGFRVGIIYP